MERSINKMHENAFNKLLLHGREAARNKQLSVFKLQNPFDLLSSRVTHPVSQIVEQEQDISELSCTRY